MIVRFSFPRITKLGVDNSMCFWFDTETDTPMMWFDAAMAALSGFVQRNECLPDSLVWIPLTGQHNIWKYATESAEPPSKRWKTMDEACEYLDRKAGEITDHVKAFAKAYEAMAKREAEQANQPAPEPQPEENREDDHHPEWADHYWEEQGSPDHVDG